MLSAGRAQHALQLFCTSRRPLRTSDEGTCLLNEVLFFMCAQKQNCGQARPTSCVTSHSGSADEESLQRPESLLFQKTRHSQVELVLASLWESIRCRVTSHPAGLRFWLCPDEIYWHGPAAPVVFFLKRHIRVIIVCLSLKLQPTVMKSKNKTWNLCRQQRFCGKLVRTCKQSKALKRQ